MIQPQRDTRKAFHWILDILERWNVPYLISGGLAARTFGSPRPLADIDIYVPAESMAELGMKLSRHAIKPPHNHRSAFWNVIYMVLEYCGQRIELVSSHDVKILDTRKILWTRQQIDFSRFEWKTIMGRKARIQHRDDLIAYKTILGRLVDIEDIQHIQTET
jgi:hypothetical protein